MNLNSTPKNSVGVLSDLSLTNIDIIDVQHKKIIELLQKLEELKGITIDFEAVSIVLNELDEYMNFHFETEENLMKCVSLGNIEKHIQQHDFFRVKLSEFKKKNGAKGMYLNRLNYELLLTFLRKWLFLHYQEFDSLYIIPVQQYLATTGNNHIV